MKRYPKYKDSGVEWLGEIPAHWEVKRNKIIFKEKKNVVGEKATEFTLLSLTLRGVIARDIENPKGKFPAEFNTYKIVEPNNLIFCLFDIDETPRTVGHSRQKGMITGAYTIVQCVANFDSYYFYYYYLSLDLNKQLKLLYTGLRKVITRDTFFTIKSPVPPPKEQKAIAHFLDDKIQQIEQFIRNKQRLIELLNEQKTAIINRAVTKGINPNAPMKHSGIEWLGEIPAHWEVRRLRYIGSCQNGISKGADYFGFGYPFVNYTDVYANFELPKMVIGLANSTDIDRIMYSVKEGDIFFTRTSETIEEIGITSTCLSSLENATFSGFLIRVRPFANLILPGFSKYYFRCQLHRFFFVKEMNLVTRASLSQDLLKKLPVLLPPLSEQKAIASFIEEKLAKIDQAIAQIEKEIELIQEYRTTLISDAVTGKIDVRPNSLIETTLTA
jgi:type I restriction enzyme S subunit